MVHERSIHGSVASRIGMTRWSRWSGLIWPGGSSKDSTMESWNHFMSSISDCLKRHQLTEVLIWPVQKPVFKTGTSHRRSPFQLHITGSSDSDITALEVDDDCSIICPRPRTWSWLNDVPWKLTVVCRTIDTFKTSSISDGSWWGRKSFARSCKKSGEVSSRKWKGIFSEAVNTRTEGKKNLKETSISFWMLDREDIDLHDSVPRMIHFLYQRTVSWSKHSPSNPREIVSPR
jgi:hypothetical protein